MTQVQRSIRLQINQGTALNRSTGETGEIFYDTTNKTLRIYDGRTSSGSILATETWVNANTINQSELTTTLNSYVTNTSLTTTLNSYVTNTSLTTTLNSYVTNTSLTTTLNSYATTASVTSAINAIPLPPVATTSQSGTVKVDGTSITITNGVISAKSTPPTGQIFNAPVGALSEPDYLPCNGSAYLRSTYPTLASLLGTPYDIFTPTAGTFGYALTQDQAGFVQGPSSFAANNGTVYCFIASGQVYNSSSIMEGGPAIWYSTDNANWTRVQLTMSGLYYADEVGTPIFLKYLNGAFYACYTDKLNGVKATRMARSTNGTTWTDITETAFGSWGDGTVQACDLTYANGKYVLATQGNVLYTSSTANIGSWTSESITLGGVVKIAYGNNTWVLMCGYYVSYSTDNRATWTDVSLDWTNGLNEIVFSNGIFVTGDQGCGFFNYPGGNYNPIYTSTDGYTWTASNNSNINWGDIPQYTNDGSNVIDISTNGDGVWVVLSKAPYLNQNSYLLYSTDNAETWTGVKLSGSFSNSISAYNWYGGNYDQYPYVQSGSSSGSITFNGGFVIYQTFQDNASGRQGVIPFRFIARTYDPVTQFITPNISVTNQGQAQGVNFLPYIKT